MISIKFLCFVVIFQLTWGYERQLNSTINPGCPSTMCKNGHNISMVHVSAYGPDDIIHYVWDYTEKPSVLLAVTNLESVLEVDCENYCNEKAKSIKFSEGTLYNFSIVFNKIIEYNDKDDEGNYNQSKADINIFHTQNFKWKLKSFVEDEYLAQAYITGDGYEVSNIIKNGLFSLSFKAFSRHGFDDILPHLLHTANSSQIEIELENIEMDKAFNSSRFAVEVLLISPRGSNYSLDATSKRSLDDEYAPGVFEIVELITSKQTISNRGAYLQYRPVSYTSKDRLIANSTDVNKSFSFNLTDSVKNINHSIANRFYDNYFNDSFISAMNVSFGTPGDGFYKNRNYTTWTFTLGYGKPPHQKFSLVVIVVICVALGTPFLLMVTGILYFCCKHYMEQKRELLS